MQTEQIQKLIEALEKIALLDPHTDSEEINEWAEADCFNKAASIATAALKELGHDFEAAIDRKYANAA